MDGMATPNLSEPAYIIDKRLDGTYLIEVNSKILGDMNYEGIERTVEEALQHDATMRFDLRNVVQVKDEFIELLTKQVIENYARSGSDWHDSRQRAANYFKQHVKAKVGREMPRGLGAYKDVFEIVQEF